ncbi:hypothetical protein J3A83DRAFT_4370705 [Scleroderma citrinum]
MQSSLFRFLHTHLLHPSSTTLDAIVSWGYTIVLPLSPVDTLPDRELDSVTDVVANVVLCYDFILTLSREVELFWKKPHSSWAFALFVANRYIPIIARIPVLLGLFWPGYKGEDGSLSVTSTSCKTVTVYEQFEIVIVQLIGGAIMIMRIYALYEKSRRALLFLLVFAMLCVGVGCWAILSPESSGSPIVPNPPLQYGCDTPLTVDQATRTLSECANCQLAIRDLMKRADFAITWSGQLAFDVIVLTMTLWRSLRIRKWGNRALLDVLIRDGVLYFVVMCVANVGNITALLVCRTATGKVAMVGFTNSISVTMISRLMLNLRDPEITASSRLITPTNLRDGTLLVTTVVSADFTCPSRYVDESTLELQRVSIRS